MSNDMPQGALDIAMTTTEKLAKLLPDGTLEHFYVYGGLLQLGAIERRQLGLHAVSGCRTPLLTVTRCRSARWFSHVHTSQSG